MELTDMILVTEDEKGTERNFLMNVIEYLKYVGERTKMTPLASSLHTLDLERTKEDGGEWTEVYSAANKTVYARYCYDIIQLCDFLAGVHNDRNGEHYFCAERCSKDCLEKLEEIGVEHDGKYRCGQEKHAYQVEVKEVLSRIQTVHASSLGEAIDKVMQQYHASEIVLDAEDFKGVTIKQEEKEKIRL